MKYSCNGSQYTHSIALPGFSGSSYSCTRAATKATCQSVKKGSQLRVIVIGGSAHRIVNGPHGRN
eukprot:6127185-Pyramimonas_sp.AAC.1